MAVAAIPWPASATTEVGAYRKLGLGRPIIDAGNWRPFSLAFAIPFNDPITK